MKNIAQLLQLEANCRNCKDMTELSYIMVNETRELNKVMFADVDNNYKLSLLLEATKYIDAQNANIVLDEKIHLLKKEFFKEAEDDTLDNLATKFIVKLLGDARDEKTIYYKGYNDNRDSKSVSQVS